MQRALSWLRDELMPDGKLEWEPQQRDDDEVEPGWRRGASRQIRDSHRQECVGQDQRPLTEELKRIPDRAAIARKTRRQYGRDRKQESGASGSGA